MSRTIDYYYAVISGFAYLGEPKLRCIAGRAGAEIRYCPVDIARVFAATDTTAPAKQSPSRRAYRDLELARWAAIRSLPINVKPRHWPVPAGVASRAVLAAQAYDLDPGPLSTAFLTAVWAEDENISDPATVERIANDVLVGDAARVLELAGSAEGERLFEDATAAAIEAGVFGSPTMFVDGEMFFGQDRLDLVARKLGLTA